MRSLFWQRKQQRRRLLATKEEDSKAGSGGHRLANLGILNFLPLSYSTKFEFSWTNQMLIPPPGTEKPKPILAIIGEKREKKEGPFAASGSDREEERN